MKLRLVSWIALGVLFLLHNDLWLWDDARIVLGLPVGLLYHLSYCLIAAVLLAVILRSGLQADDPLSGDPS